MGRRKFQGKFYIYIDAKQPLLQTAETVRGRGKKAAGNQEEGVPPRCLTPGTAEAGELWAEWGAILPLQEVPGPGSHKAGSQ